MSLDKLLTEAERHTETVAYGPTGSVCMKCAGGWPCLTRRLTDALRNAPDEGLFDEQMRTIARLRAEKDSAYSERNALVAALSKLLPAWLERHPEDEEWEDDWRWIVFIEHTSTGQMTWHIHDSELPNFDHLPRSNAHRWDGHTTAEKYERLRALDGGEG